MERSTRATQRTSLDLLQTLTKQIAPYGKFRDSLSNLLHPYYPLLPKWLLNLLPANCLGYLVRVVSVGGLHLLDLGDILLLRLLGRGALVHLLLPGLELSLALYYVSVLCMCSRCGGLYPYVGR